MAGVGEGLHYIPGCGHGIEIGNRVLLLGLSLPEGRQSLVDRPLVERPNGRDIPIYDEDLCAICSAIGMRFASVHSFQIVQVMPFVYDLPAAVSRDAFAATVRLFQARAPPLV